MFPDISVALTMLIRMTGSYSIATMLELILPSSFVGDIIRFKILTFSSSFHRVAYFYEILNVFSKHHK